MKTKLPNKRLSRILLVLLILTVLGIGCLLSVNGYVVHTTADQILSAEEATTLTDADCILVLGCYVYENGEPSAMLHDRLRRSVALYEGGAAPKLLMSGDHGRTAYDEVSAMKQYALDAQVPSVDIFLDHAGFSTYESIYRAKEIFQAKKIIIVTQKYHLHRALYIANAMGLEAYGVDANYRSYAGQLSRDIREILARNKDFINSIFKPLPTFLGDPIPVFGDGNVTNG